MLSERYFLVLFGIMTAVSFGMLIFYPGEWAYAAGGLPHLVLLFYWFQEDGWNYRIFSMAWILYFITDVSATINSTYSSVLTSIFAIASIITLTTGFVLWRNGYARKRAYLALFAVAYGAGYFQLIRGSIPDELIPYIGIYAIFDAVIFIVIAGMKLRNNYSYILCLFGVSIFILSDGLYAYHFFVEPLDLGEPIMGVLHNVCRALFVLGILEEDKGEYIPDYIQEEHQ